MRGWGRIAVYLVVGAGIVWAGIERLDGRSWEDTWLDRHQVPVFLVVYVATSAALLGYAFRTARRQLRRGA